MSDVGTAPGIGKLEKVQHTGTVVSARKAVSRMRLQMQDVDFVI